MPAAGSATLATAALLASGSAAPDTSLMQMTVRDVATESLEREANATLAAPAGFSQVGRHCDCGGTVAQWFAGTRATVEGCAAECLKYPSCKAFALFVSPSVWDGACRLYDKHCADTNGWEQGTTCRSPTANPGGDSLGYNKHPGYEQLYYSTGECSVTDGSAFSSSYPCGCGDEVCLDGQVCGGTSCYLAESLNVSWPSECLSIGRTEFRRTGASASGAPVYSNGEGTYMYYDPYCNGNELESAAQWIIDSDEPNLTAFADLDGDGKCSDFAHVASGYLSGPVTEGVSWQIACDGSGFRGRSLAISLPTGSGTGIRGLTPAPTLAPGQPCQCEGCGGFSLYDVDSNGCLVEDEVDRVEGMRGMFSGLDADSDGCVTQTECSTYVEQHNLELPKYTVPITEECDYGMYLPEQASVCIPCVGGSTNRRRSHTCTPCADTEFDAGMYDDCVGGVYLIEDADEGNCTVHTNDVEGVFKVGDTITIATRNPGHFEEVTITSTSPIRIDQCLNLSFKMYDPVRRACTKADGFSFSSVYPCGCGKATCEEGQACNMGSSTGTVYRNNGTAAGTAGMCITRVTPGQPMPTPVPTISARGDPHLVNLQGEHFDVNHGGEFSLLRIPQDTRQPAGFSLMSTITAEYNRPCITYITQVALSGTWFDNKSLEVRSYLRSHSNETADKFLGARVLSAAEPAAPWQNITDWGDHRHVLANDSDYEVVVKKQQWTNHRQKYKGPEFPTVAGQFEVIVRDKRNTDGTRVIIRQDLQYQEHLNVAVRKMSALGRFDVGGLIGFDEHPDSLEDVTKECELHRTGGPPKGPKFVAPWKKKWAKIREERAHQSGSDESGSDEGGEQETGAAASLSADVDNDDDDEKGGSGSRYADSDDDKEFMCVCEAQQALDEDMVRAEAMEEAEEEAELAREGIITEFQTARLAEASWD